jgi:hypothetical protein
MTLTSVILIAEGFLLAVAIVFVLALLRSHAEILRRLGALESARLPAGMAAAASSSGARASDVAGESLAGDAVKLALGSGSSSGQTLLAFLGSGCGTCGPLWAALREGSRIPAGVRLVIVTKGHEEESLARLRELAPKGHEVLMSSQAWRDYSVEATPHFVLVDGSSGEIVGRGTAASWEQLVGLVEQANADVRVAAERTTTSERAARAEQALTRAGITPGHPSLYPSRQAVAEGRATAGAPAPADR